MVQGHVIPDGAIVRAGHVADAKWMGVGGAARPRGGKPGVEDRPHVLGDLLGGEAIAKLPLTFVHLTVDAGVAPALTATRIIEHTERRYQRGALACPGC